MNEAVLEAEPVDERLEGRARRAHRRCHIDLAGAARVEIVRRGDAREHLAGGMIDGEDRNRNVRPEGAGTLARKLLQTHLQRPVDRQAMKISVGGSGNGRVRRMRGQYRHGLASVRHRLVLGALDLVGRNNASGGNALKHPVTRVARCACRAVRTALYRGLRQTDQHDRFAQRQAARLLAEIGERRRAYAFEIAAVRRQTQIQREDLVLGERPLDLDGTHHLTQLCLEAARAARFEQPRHLHGDGRAAGNDAAVGDQLRQSAAEGERIDPVMGAKALVLVGEQKLQKPRIDVLARRRQSPAPFRRGVGPQQLSIAVHHQGGKRKPLPERRRAERGDPPAAGRQYGNNRDRCGDKAQAQPAPHAGAGPLPHTGGGGRSSLRLALVPRHRSRLTSSPRRCRWQCGQSGRAGTCPPRRPVDARNVRARRRGPHRRR